MINGWRILLQPCTRWWAFLTRENNGIRVYETGTHKADDGSGKLLPWATDYRIPRQKWSLESHLTGKEIINVDPWLTRLRAEINPWCCSTIFCKVPTQSRFLQIHHCCASAWNIRKYLRYTFARTLSRYLPHKVLTYRLPGSYCGLIFVIVSTGCYWSPVYILFCT